MLGKHIKSLFKLLLLSLLLASVSYAEDKTATQPQTLGTDAFSQYYQDSPQLEAEFVLKRPVMAVPLAEEMPTKTPVIRRKQPEPQTKNLYRYYYLKEEIEEAEGKRTIAKELDKMYEIHYHQARQKAKAESEAAYLKEAARETCRKNLQLISDAVDRYLSDHPEEIIRRFDETDATSPNGILIKLGYLNEPIPVPKGCHYINDAALGELRSGCQIYCPRHGLP